VKETIVGRRKKEMLLKNMRRTFVGRLSLERSPLFRITILFVICLSFLSLPKIVMLRQQHDIQLQDWLYCESHIL
jgi:hypothetical protein